MRVRRRPRGRQRIRWRAVAFRIGLLLVSMAALYVAGTAANLWWSWQSLDRETLDTAAYAALPPISSESVFNIGGPGGVADVGPNGPATVITEILERSATTSATGGSSAGNLSADASAAGPDPYDAYLVVGSDASDHRGDAIILILLPTDQSAPLMVSLPRDLYLPNRCTQSLTRINANYAGCGEVNGATQLAGAVEDFTGIGVDHFALFTMDGFERIIDAIGGMEICVDHPVRERGRVELPAGCTMADGHTALGWVRSRKTQEYRDGNWRTMTGVSDLTRNQRQQDLILAVMAKAREFDSPADLSEFAASLSDTFTLDHQLGLGEAVDLVWTHRDLSPDQFIRLTIPVEPYTTPAGAQVLLPTASFADILAEATAAH